MTMWFSRTLTMGSLIVAAVVCPARACAQIQIEESFDVRPLDRTHWRLPKGGVVHSEEERSQLEGGERFFHHEDGELRFVLPPSNAKREQLTVAGKFALSGDFRIEAVYRLESVPIPGPTGYVNFEVMIAGDDGTLFLARTRHSSFGEGYSLFFRPSESRAGELAADNKAAGNVDPSNAVNDQRIWRFLASDTTSGKLSLERRGATVSAVCDGKLLASVSMGAGDINNLTYGTIIQGVTYEGVEMAVEKFSVECSGPGMSNLARILTGVLAGVIVVALILMRSRRHRSETSSGQIVSSAPPAPSENAGAQVSGESSTDAPNDPDVAHPDEGQTDEAVGPVQSIDDFNVT